MIAVNVCVIYLLIIALKSEFSDHFICRKLQLNIDMIVAMKCARKCLSLMMMMMMMMMMMNDE